MYFNNFKTYGADMITGYMDEMDHTLNSTFAGQEIAQRWSDLFIFERTFQELKPDLIIELGTYCGALTHFLSLHGKVWTIDNLDRRINKYRNVTYNIGDVFSEEIEREISDLILSHDKVLLFCDNGNKIDEFNKYAKYLKEGDLIFVHDWNDEIKMKDIEQTIKKYNLKPYLHELSEKHNSLLRGWIK